MQGIIVVWRRQEQKMDGLVQSAVSSLKVACGKPSNVNGNDSVKMGKDVGAEVKEVVSERELDVVAQASGAKGAVSEAVVYVKAFPEYKKTYDASPELWLPKHRGKFDIEVDEVDSALRRKSIQFAPVRKFSSNSSRERVLPVRLAESKEDDDGNSLEAVGGDGCEQDETLSESYEWDEYYFKPLEKSKMSIACGSASEESDIDQFDRMLEEKMRVQKAERPKFLGMEGAMSKFSDPSEDWKKQNVEYHHCLVAVVEELMTVSIDRSDDGNVLTHECKEVIRAVHHADYVDMEDAERLRQYLEGWLPAGMMSNFIFSMKSVARLVRSQKHKVYFDEEKSSFDEIRAGLLLKIEEALNL